MFKAAATDTEFFPKRFRIISPIEKPPARRGFHNSKRVVTVSPVFSEKVGLRRIVDRHLLSAPLIATPPNFRPHGAARLRKEGAVISGSGSRSVGTPPRFTRLEVLSRVAHSLTK